MGPRWKTGLDDCIVLEWLEDDWLMAQHLMFSVCPLSEATMVLERASDILMAPSVEPAAKKLPASFKASAYTLPLCPSQALGSYSPPCRATSATTDSAVCVLHFA